MTNRRAGELLGMALLVLAIFLFVALLWLPHQDAVLAVLALLAALLISSGLLRGGWVFARVQGRVQTQAQRQANDNTWLDDLFVPQPATIRYVFNTAWIVVALLWDQLWPAVHDVGRRAFWLSQRGQAQFQVNPNRAFQVWMGVGVIAAAGAGTVHYLAVWAAAALLFAAQCVLFALWLLVTVLLMALLRGANAVYLRLQRKHFRCPHCYKRMTIPVYVCPNCRVSHSQLQPSIYGLFFHTCRGSTDCDERLPAMGWLRRSTLEMRCPHCGQVFAGRGRDFHIPIVGGPDAGKTHLLITALHGLIDIHAAANRLQITIPDETQRATFEQACQQLDAGQPLAKMRSTRAFNVQVQRPARLEPNLLYFYDVPGEVYASQDDAARQSYFRYVHGIVLVVDPFALQMLRARLPDPPDAPPEPLDHVFERMLDVLETRLGRRNGRFALPLAVVVTKTDMLDLENRIGAPAAQRLLNEDRHLRSEADAINVLTERFLTEHGAGNFTRGVRHQFKTVRYFSCSVQSGDPVRVLEPVLWVLGCVRAL